MGKKVDFKLNSSGVAELLQSPGVKTICEGAARQVLSSSGSGFEMDTRISGDRVAARVRVASKEAYHRCLEDNILLKALGGVNV